MKLLVTGLLMCFFFQVNAQNDPLDFGEEAETILIQNTFNGTTIVNNQSTNISDGGQLSLLISHRFGSISEGAYNFFGLDAAVMRLGFDYGVSNKLTAGIGRSNTGKSFDGYLKYRLLTQTKGMPAGNTPIAITIFSSASFSSEKLRVLNQASDKNQFFPNLTYILEPVVSREFTSKLSVQIVPTYIHRNQTDFTNQAHNIYALGASALVKLTNRLNLTLDYNYISDKEKIAAYKIYDPMGVGLEVVTGGHIFKVYATNSIGIIEKEFLLNTTDDFFNGDIHLGFTLLRSFIIKPKIKGGSLR